MSRRILVLAAVVALVAGSAYWLYAENPQGSAKQESTKQEQTKQEQTKQEQNKQESKKPKIDPQAEKVLHGFADYIQDLKAFECEVAISIKGEMIGQKVDLVVNQNIKLERPNKLSIAVTSNQPSGGVQLVSDGSELFVYVEPLEKYAVEPAPATLKELLETPVILGLIAAGNSSALTTALFSDDPYKTLTESVTELSYLGKEELDGVQTQHVKAQSETADWDLWIEAGPKPLPRQFSVDMQRMFERLAKQNPQIDVSKIKVENKAVVSKWNVDPKFQADSFAFTTPEKAEKVESLMKIFERGAEESPADKLVGNPAPAFELPTLSGDPANLADQKDKVVVLDFWATWCGPCRSAMPIIAKVTSSLKDRGVVFYAVNIDEDAETIKDFLQEQKLDIPVALDKGGEIAKAYLANAIPETVIIGKDGRVQVVHVGLSPNLEEELTKELEALIDGKDLAAEKAKSSDAEDDAQAKPAESETEEDGEKTDKGD